MIILEEKNKTEDKPEPVNPSTQAGNYVIITEVNGQRRSYAVFGGTVQIVSLEALRGSFELK